MKTSQKLRLQIMLPNINDVDISDTRFLQKMGKHINKRQRSHSLFPLACTPCMWSILRALAYGLNMKSREN